MYMMARLYTSEAQARATVEDFMAAGYSSDDIATLSSQTTQTAAADPSTEAAAAAPAAPSADDMANAVRVGRMLGTHADYYMSHLTEGRTLVVATPPFIASAKAESIMNRHDPLSFSHEPEREEYVPWSQQATPFSNMLRLPVLSDGPVFSNVFGFKTKQEGFSHFSQWFPPLSSKSFFSEKFGMSLLTDNATPLSSMLNWSTKSDRTEGKTATFGMSLQASRGLPLSSMLGLPVLTKRKRFLTS